MAGPFGQYATRMNPKYHSFLLFSSNIFPRRFMSKSRWSDLVKSDLKVVGIQESGWFEEDCIENCGMRREMRGFHNTSMTSREGIRWYHAMQSAVCAAGTSGENQMSRPPVHCSGKKAYRGSGMYCVCLTCNLWLWQDP